MKETLMAAVLLTVPAIFAQDEVFPVRYQQIKQLKPAEAEAAYVELAEKIDVLPAAKHLRKQEQADAAFLAAVEKALDGGNAANAPKYAARIQSKAIQDFANIKILEQRNKWAELVGFSKGLEIKSWPDALIPRAALIRGKAYAENKNFDRAETDLQLAIDATAPANEKYVMIYRVAAIYGASFKDPDKEMAVLRQGFPLENNLPHLYRQRVNCRYAMLLSDTGRISEAIKFLEEYAPKCDAAPIRQFNIKVTLGNLYARNNDKARSSAFFREAAAVPELPERFKKLAEEKLTK